MATTHSLSRRSALAGLGAGSLGLFFGASATAAPPALDTGGGGGGALLAADASTAPHPLTGLWLSHISRDGDETAAAPAFFGADGTAVLVYPCAEANENGTQIRGLALGTWAPIDDHEARFTAVQVCFGADGTYQGTRTYDGYPVVSDDGTSFAVKGEFDLVTVRDAGNAIVASIAGARRAMVGTRMTPGNAGFMAAARTGGEEGQDQQILPSGIPEVAPVHPGDPRLTPQQSAPKQSLGAPQ